jgi:16S rRNA processing protein RimM
MKKESLVKIGYVMKTHGLKGEVTLNLAPDAPELSVKDVLMVDQNGGHVPFFVQQISINGNKVFLKLEDVNTFEQASQLKGCSIFIEKSKRPKLKRGEFYDDELDGFEVVDKTHGSLGSVTKIISQGLSRLLEVGERNLLIPINGPFITSISKTKKKIEVELPEGFLEI